MIQWKEKLRLRDIIVWQDEEIFVTKILAEYRRKPYFVVPFKQPYSSVYKILFKKMKKVYLSYPMTHVENYQEYMKRIEHFKEKISKFFVVFDPAYIDDYGLLVKAYDAIKKDKNRIDVNGMSISINEVLEIEKDLRDQTVRRDFMLIDQSEAIIVYYTLPTLSPGVLSEIIYSYTNNKDVYLIFTASSRISPFLEYFTTKIFHEEDSFFEFLEENFV